MKLKENVSLKDKNTFGIAAKASKYIEINSENQLQEFFRSDVHLNAKLLILGGGSNMLLTQDFDGIVLKNNILGKNIISENENEVIVEAGAGENWHEFVCWSLENNWCGLENLSLIPGNVGAAPMQNIGAYGVELKDNFFQLKAFLIDEKRFEFFDLNNCEFAYRSSIFKTNLKNKAVICKVQFRLKKNADLNTSYGAIEAELKNLKLEKTSKNIAQAVINIRRSKLPDPKEIGNAGSFFKNPVVSNQHFEKIKSNFPDVVAYPVNESQTKLAAGWMIEKCGFKGKTYDNRYGVHKKQALVLVNYSDAKGSEILALSDEIIQAVHATFQVMLEREVNII